MSYEIHWAKFFPIACYIAYTVYSSLKKKKTNELVQPVIKKDSYLHSKSPLTEKFHLSDEQRPHDYMIKKEGKNTLARSSNVHSLRSKKAVIVEKKRLPVKRRLNIKATRRMLCSKIIFERKYFQISDYS